MLELTDISFSYGTKRVLEGVNLSLKGGEMLVTLGSNGAGKSTLLKLASGALIPEAGAVNVCGKILKSYRARELAKMRAFLEQDSSLAFDAKVLDVVLLGRYTYGAFASSAEDLAFARGALVDVGLENFEDRFFMSLSGGEKRRVMLARVLAQLARTGDYANTLLILDEPSSGLDPAHAHGALAAARKLVDKGCAVLAVLHDPNLAAQYADKIAFLKSGKLIEICSAADAMNAEILEKTYACKCKIISDGASKYALFLKR